MLRTCCLRVAQQLHSLPESWNKFKLSKGPQARGLMVSMYDQHTAMTNTPISTHKSRRPLHNLSSQQPVRVTNHSLSQASGKTAQQQVPTDGGRCFMYVLSQGSACRAAATASVSDPSYVLLVVPTRQQQQHQQQQRQQHCCPQLVQQPCQAGPCRRHPAGQHEQQEILAVSAQPSRCSGRVAYDKGLHINSLTCRTDYQTMSQQRQLTQPSTCKTQQHTYYNS